MADEIVMAEETLDLGTRHRGELPPDQPIVFTESDGTTVIDLTGYSVRLTVQRLTPGSTAATAEAAAISLTDEANGEATIDVDADLLGDGLGFWEQPAGDYEGLAWVGNGTRRYASKLLKWRIVEPPGGLIPAI